jgi:Ca2+-binding RTX toxin-like protein
MPNAVTAKPFVDQLREIIMTIRNVGPGATYPSIAAAVAAAAAGDTIALAPGYSDELAVLTVQDLTVQGAASSLNISLELGVGIGNVTLGGLADIDVWDNSGNNNITGNAGANNVRVSSGADVVLGGGGVDRLMVNYADTVTSVTGTVGGVTDGGTHSVTFEGVEDFVILTGSGTDTLTTGDGDNVLRSGAGNDTITTGHGNSRIDSGAGNDTVTTGDGNNNVNGSGGDNTITTGAGDDLVSSARGDDTLITGSGNDVVQARGGNDTADAGTGSDLLEVNYGHLLTNVTGSLSSGTLPVGYSGLVADAAGNSVSFVGVERFDITTGAGDDRVHTGGGTDTIQAGMGQDFLNGGGGNDTLRGGGNADTLVGGRGADELIGGTGSDRFRFDDLDSAPGASDLIVDLQDTDVIDLSRIDADVSAGGDQAFALVGSFSGTAGEAVITYQAAGDLSRLSLDTDGDGSADIAISLVGDHRGFDSFLL